METLQRINEALLVLLKTRNYQEIDVSLLCNQAQISQSAFYDHYCDLSELADVFCQRVEEQFSAQPHDETAFSWMFTYMVNNPDTFNAYFKLPYREKKADYKTIFFCKGLYSVAKMWFEEGCKESPEQMGKIILREYCKLFQ